MGAFKYEPGQILVHGGHYGHVTFFRVERRTAAYVATVALEKDFIPAADRREGFWDGTWRPTDQIHFQSQRGPKRWRIKVDGDGNEFGAPANTVWDGIPVQGCP